MVACSPLQPVPRLQLTTETSIICQLQHVPLMATTTTMALATTFAVSAKKGMLSARRTDFTSFLAPNATGLSAQPLSL